ncbi:hypothetical protein ACHAPT_013100 [Fusarium lateritium]
MRIHRKTHAAKTVDCFGCSKAFISDSAMMLHLEAASCDSGADKTFVAEVAFDCHYSDEYVSDDPDFDFQCPTCDTLFSLMSGLLQHVESDSCDEHATRYTPLGRFLHYLGLRVDEL